MNKTETTHGSIKDAITIPLICPHITSMDFFFSVSAAAKGLLSISMS